MNEVQVYRSNLPAKPHVEPPKEPRHHIVGLHVENYGDVALVWIGVDWEDSKRESGRVTLCDSFVFPRETPLAVIADGIKKRGEWKPIAWRNDDEEFIELLKDHGCTRLSGYDETQAVCEATVRQFLAQLEAGTFLVRPNNQAWENEYNNLALKDGVIPMTGYPLLGATRHALKQLRYAREWKPRRKVEPFDWGGSVA